MRSFVKKPLSELKKDFVSHGLLLKNAKNPSKFRV